jgi:predicted O-linked N-acetylglucosamine transferase (SPINDLY family)
MDIIAAVSNSALWLLRSSDSMPASSSRFPDEAEPRLRGYWAGRGLDNNRLIFSNLTSPQENLRRMGSADIHLDTLLFNGHTTSSDSLFKYTLDNLMNEGGQDFQSSRRRVSACLHELELPCRWLWTAWVWHEI